MTTDECENKNEQQHCRQTEQQQETTTTEVDTSSIPQEIRNIFECLSLNSKIIFKSQQRDEPEISQPDKMQLAMSIYKRNPATFLNRFGKYLEEQQLQHFAKYAVAESDEEMLLMVDDYQKKLKSRKQDIKNRRFAAMQKLMAEGDYFSEQEMMKRSPTLYQELVGQYLSEDERKLRDSYDVRNTTFSGILMHNLEQQQITNIMEKAEQSEEIKSAKETEITNLCQQEVKLPEEEEDDDTMEGLDKDCEEEVPVNCRNQWGNFDNEQIACSSSKINNEVKKKPKPTINLQNMITSDERELLKQEFLSQMHEQFLCGQDADFDYATVDDNTQYDDLKLLNQDKEDKYFDESDDDDDDGNEQPKARDNTNAADDSEDELDIFMSHLKEHHSLRS